MRRKRMRVKSSNKLFKKGMRVHSKNVKKMPSRGGIRL